MGYPCHMKNVALLIAACGMVLSLMFFSSAPLAEPEGAHVAPPFDVAAIRERAGAEDSADFTCNSPPSPLEDLRFETFYRDVGDSASIVDPEAYGSYQVAVKPLRDMESGLTNMANRYVRSNPPRPDIAACVLDWMWIWAREKAMMGDINRSGEFVRKWALASLATTWIQIRDDRDLDPKKRRKVEFWLRGITNEVKRDYSRDRERMSRRNNHLYWAAWSVAAAGAALDDPVMFAWAMKRASVGIDEIDQDGTLPLELERGRKAFHYHVFSATPLFMLAGIAQRNGIDLYAENEDALERLSGLILKNADNPSYFRKLTGEEQDMTRSLSASNLVWLELYDKLYPDRRARKRLKQLRPLRASRVGGDATLLYGPE